MTPHLYSQSLPAGVMGPWQGNPPKPHTYFEETKISRRRFQRHGWMSPQAPKQNQCLSRGTPMSVRWKLGDPSWLPEFSPVASPPLIALRSNLRVSNCHTGRRCKANPQRLKAVWWPSQRWARGRYPLPLVGLRLDIWTIRWLGKL